MTTYSFEPNRKTFDVLKANIALNELSRCRIFNIAIGKYKGHYVLLIKIMLTMVCVKVNHDADGDIVQETIDNFWKDKKGEISIVKIDTEGDEKNIIEEELRQLSSTCRCYM